MKEILVAVLVSSVVSSVMTLILTRKIAACHFEVIDGYAMDMIEVAKMEINKAYCKRWAERITGKNQSEKEREQTATNLGKLHNDEEYRESLKVPMAESVLYTGVSQQINECE